MRCTTIRVASKALIYFALSILGASTASTFPSITNVTMSGSAPQLTILSDVGATNEILCVTNITQTNWTVLTNIVVSQSSYTFTDIISSPSPQRFYRIAELTESTNTNTNTPSAPPGMSLIPKGIFEMGDSFYEGAEYEIPIHAVYVSSFYMDKYEVTYALWSNVVAWSVTNGYTYDNPGAYKATNHPVQMVSWYDVVKWCNARSEMEGLLPSYFADSNLTQIYRTGEVEPFVDWNAGYRLPTEAEWEKADRGGADGHRFPWTNTDTISHSQANYYSGDTNQYTYDVSPTSGYNPLFVDNMMPYTSPVGYFAPNGYGLYDTAGNVWEWCWDYAGNYSSDMQTDPRGPSSGDTRVGRGGNWNFYAVDCRDSYRYGNSPTDTASNIGFRTARPAP
ncbi:MAG TPA: formylglycine-generating enzyme family protein [Verrucomicrobiae bacterium]|jgi:formylglycine-generating enzyme required for sulfatase activity